MKLFTLFLSVIQLLISAITFAQAGSLDLTFDADGKQITDFQLYFNAAVRATTVQTDGKILATGYIESETLDFSGNPYTSVILSRYNSDGTPDNSFGSGGSVITRAGTMSDAAYAIVLQKDGKIVVAGGTGVSGGTNILIIRYMANGTIDNTFGVNGKVITDISANHDDAALAIKIQKDGKIIVGGYSYLHGNFAGYSVLARYNTNGSLDNTFGTMGMVLDNGVFISQINALTIQPDNKILTAGYGEGFPNDPKVMLRRFNIDGTSDITFGLNGYAVIDMPQAYWDEAVSVMVQPDNKIVISGNSYNTITYSGYYFFTARFNSNGSLDNSFGSGGIIVKYNDYSERSIAATVQNDGKIVMATSALNFFRFNTNGTTDYSFGINGIAHTDMGSNVSGEAYSAVMQSDNKVIASGYYTNVSNENQNYRASNGFAISRLTANGAADNLFGSSGIVKTDFKTANSSADYGQSVVIGQGGHIVMGGYSYAGALLNQSLLSDNVDGSPDVQFNLNGKLTKNYGGNFKGFSLAVQTDDNLLLAGKWHNGSNYDFAVTRYLANGYPDFNNFGSGGIAHVATGSSDESAYAATIQADGKIVLAGTSYNGHDYDIALARFNSNGSIDNTFSFDGVLMKNISNGNDYAYSVAVQPDGKIVVGGYGYNGVNDDLIVLRFLANGSADNSFGTGGVVRTGITKASNDYGRALKIQTDGKIILAGYTTNGANNDYVILRYNPNGTLDNTFNTTGFVTGSFDVASNDFCTSAAIQADGRIVIAGYYYKNATNKNDFAVTRYLSNGKPDVSFGTASKVLTDFGGTDDYANAVTLQQDGKIIVAGTSANDFALARYNSTGTAVLSSIDNAAFPEALKSVPDQFSIIPNPVSANASVLFYNSEKRHIDMELFDALGRKVKSIGVMDDIGMRTFSFSREGLKAGIYFVRVKARNWTKIKKVVIE